MKTLFNSPDKFKSRFAEVDGYKTHFIEAGSDDADRLILIHGGACEIGMGNYRWYPNIIPLSRNFHVFAIDEYSGAFHFGSRLVCAIDRLVLCLRSNSLGEEVCFLAREIHCERKPSR